MIDKSISLIIIIGLIFITFYEYNVMEYQKRLAKCGNDPTFKKTSHEYKLIKLDGHETYYIVPKILVENIPEEFKMKRE